MAIFKCLILGTLLGATSGYTSEITDEPLYVMTINKSEKSLLETKVTRMTQEAFNNNFTDATEKIGDLINATAQVSKKTP